LVTSTPVSNVNAASLCTTLGSRLATVDELRHAHVTFGYSPCMYCSVHHIVTAFFNYIVLAHPCVVDDCTCGWTLADGYDADTRIIPRGAIKRWSIMGQAGQRCTDSLVNAALTSVNGTTNGLSGPFRCLDDTLTSPTYCINHTLCAFNACLNGGTCVVTTNMTQWSNGYRCLCPVGVSGARCQTVASVVMQGIHPSIGLDDASIINLPSSVTIDGSIVTGSLVLNDSITTNTTSTLSARLAAIESRILKLASLWMVFGSVNNVTLQPYTNQTIALDFTTLTSTCTITNITATSSSLAVTPLKSIQMKSISSGELNTLHFRCII
jgi:hypothetical protein